MASNNGHKNKASFSDQVLIREQPRATTIFDLPSEIRHMIFIQANQSSLEVHKDTAALLSAFSNHANPRVQSLYDEAKGVYTTSFFSVNWENEETFKKLKRFEKMRIKHLEVVAPLRFEAQPIVIQNTIQCLTLDFSKNNTIDDQEMNNIQPRRACSAIIQWPRDPEDIAKYIISGSKEVKRVVLKMKTNGKDLSLYAEIRVKHFTAELGVDVKEKGVLEKGVAYWVWEAKGDSTFSWPLIDYRIRLATQNIS